MSRRLKELSTSTTQFTLNAFLKKVINDFLRETLGCDFVRNPLFSLDELIDLRETLLQSTNPNHLKKIIFEVATKKVLIALLKHENEEHLESIGTNDFTLLAYHDFLEFKYEVDTKEEEQNPISKEDNPQYLDGKKYEYIEQAMAAWESFFNDFMKKNGRPIIQIFTATSYINPERSTQKPGGHESTLNNFETILDEKLMRLDLSKEPDIAPLFEFLTEENLQYLITCKLRNKAMPKNEPKTAYNIYLDAIKKAYADLLALEEKAHKALNSRRLPFATASQYHEYRDTLIATKKAYDKNPSITNLNHFEKAKSIYKTYVEKIDHQSQNAKGIAVLSKAIKKPSRSRSAPGLFHEKDNIEKKLPRAHTEPSSAFRNGKQ